MYNHLLFSFVLVIVISYLYFALRLLLLRYLFELGWTPGSINIYYYYGFVEGKPN